MPAVVVGTMNAIARDRYGSADDLRLRDVEPPQVGDEDVLVRVRAAASTVASGTSWPACPTCSAAPATACAGPRPPDWAPNWSGRRVAREERDDTFVIAT